jgi:site-specific recombinase XerD
MSALFQQFAIYLRTQDRSENTVSGYVRDLRFFARWFRGTNGESLTPEAVTPLDAREYRAYLLNVKKQAGSTVNRKLAALRAWLAWAEERGKIEANPAQNIKGVELGRRKARWLSRRETYALLRELQKADQLAAVRAGGDPGHPALVQAKRDAAVVALLLHAGLRVGEVAALEVGDVKVSDRKGQVIVRYGKGGKERTVPLNSDARAALEAWLDMRQAGGESLFFGKGGEPLSERGIQYLVKKYAERAGLERCSPHILRHTFGKNLANAQVGLERIAELLGHSNLETTRIYVRPSTGDLAEAVELVAWSD